MGHVVLLGDSVFDNARYVPERPAVISQVQHCLPKGWQATLLAVDGDIVSDVAQQILRLPSDASHLFISVGGNDALGAAGILGEPAATVADALVLLDSVLNEFRHSYQRMLQAVGALDKPTALCTIYDAIPGLAVQDRTALSAFNEVILREAFASGLPVIDLRFTCCRPEDFSIISPIEPSHLGGSKIARAITEIATKHDFRHPNTVIYS